MSILNFPHGKAVYCKCLDWVSFLLSDFKVFLPWGGLLLQFLALALIFVLRERKSRTTVLDRSFLCP